MNENKNQKEIKIKIEPIVFNSDNCASTSCTSCIFWERCLGCLVDLSTKR